SFGQLQDLFEIPNISTLVLTKFLQALLKLVFVHFLGELLKLFQKGRILLGLLFLALEPFLKQFVHPGLGGMFCQGLTELIAKLFHQGLLLLLPLQKILDPVLVLKTKTPVFLLSLVGFQEASLLILILPEGAVHLLEGGILEVQLPVLQLFVGSNNSAKGLASRAF